MSDPDPITGAVDGTYSQNTEHAAEAVSHLIQFFREGPRNQAVLEAVMVQVQEVEDLFWYMREGFDVNTAVGEQLEFIGKRVGEGRQDRTDAQYRSAIRVRILINMSTGTMNELLAICEGINPTGIFIARDLYPAALSIEADTFDTTSLASAYLMLFKAKTAGVRLHLVVGPSATLGSSDASPAGGILGSSDASPAGFVLGSGR